MQRGRASGCKRSEGQPRLHLHMARALERWSAQLGQPSDLDQALQQAVQEIGQLCAAERACLVACPDATWGNLADYAWCSDGAPRPVAVASDLSRWNAAGLLDALRQGQLVKVPEVAQLPTTNAARHLLAEMGIRSLLLVPWNTDYGPFGFICLQNVAEPATWTDENLTLLKIIAQSLGNAVEKRAVLHNLEQRIADRTRELSALYAITAVSSEHLGLQVALEHCLTLTLQALGKQQGLIQLLDEDGCRVRLASYRGVSPGLPMAIDQVTPDMVPTGWVAAHDKPLFIPDLSDTPHRVHPACQRLFHSYLGAPIRALGRVQGAINIFSRADQPFKSDDVTLLATIASRIGMSVENAELRQRARQAAVMEERQRLARELHDSATQALYGLALFAHAGQQEAEAGNLSAVQEYMGKMAQAAQQALKEIRLLIYQLRPPLLEQEGLVSALQQRLEAVEKRAGVRTRLAAELPVSLPKRLESEVYAAAQEMLNNALRHARAKQVEVTICSNARQLTLEVADDGCGFEVSRAGASGGLGLVGLKERAAAIGGCLTIDSVPGKGTRVRLVAPLSGDNP